MSRSDHSRSDDAPRRTGGLSLSTGRLEGRPGSASESRRTRHNPLRDEDSDRSRPRSGTDRPGRLPSGRRNPAAGRRDHGPESFRDGHPGRPHCAHRERTPRSAGSPTRHSGLAKAIFAGAVSALTPKAPNFGSHGAPRSGGFRGIGGFMASLDLRHAGMLAMAAALAIVFIMAIAHIGPFAPAVSQDGAKHVGVQGLNAVPNNAMYISQNMATQVSLARPVEPDLAKLPAHSPTREEITALPDQKVPFAFALDTASTEGVEPPVLSDRSLVNLSNSLTYYETNGYEAGYLLMDLGTGRGIASNLDASIYGASSFKGPFCAYVVNKEFPNDINRTRSSRLTQVENTIIWSDNSAYGKLRRAYGDEGMKEWLTEAGVDTALVDDTYFPTYTARQAALMWLKIYDYLTTADTSAAQWLSDTFAKTEVSFLRNGALGTTSAGHTDYLPEEGSGTEEGVEEEQTDEATGDEGGGDGDEGAASEALISVTGADDAAGELAVAVTGETGLEAEEAGSSGEEKTVASIGTNITVRNKAGWIDGEEDDAVCDAGIVTINGRDYLMVIMTSAPDSRAGEQAFAHLARTLFEIRGDLV